MESRGKKAVMESHGKQAVMESHGSWILKNLERIMEKLWNLLGFQFIGGI